MKRRLIIGERIMYADASTPVNCVFAVKIKGILTLQGLTAALKKIQQKHPLLRTYIKEDENHIPYFVSNNTVAEIPVNMLERTHDEQWQEQSKIEWETIFEGHNKPLARLVWLKGEEVSDLLLVFPHCIGDGATFITLMNELLLLLDHPEKELNSYPPFNSIEGLLTSFKKTNGQIIKTKLFAALAKLFLSLKSKKNNLPAGDRYLLHCKLNKAKTQALTAQCKLAEVTVHAVLCVAFAEAFYAVNGKKARGKLICPVDIRRFVPEIKEDMMFAFAPIAELTVPLVSKMDFLAKAKRLKKELSAKIAAMKIPELLMMSEYFHSSVPKMISYLRTTEGSHDVTLSNMGKLAIAENYDSFEVETIYSPTVAFPWRNANTAVVSTFKGEMDFSFIANDAFLAQEQAKLILAKTLALLEVGLLAPEPVLDHG